jgi:hypothetical protein
MIKQTIVKEDAAGGATGAGAIAVAAPRLGDMRKKGSLKHFLNKFYSRVGNKVQMRPVSMPAVKESYDLSDIVSRLKGVEGMQDSDTDTHVTFGVEDDQGNVMKVSVKREQAKDFEYKMARAMADEKDGSLSGGKSKMSLAELLYDLKDEFDIVDVEFPEIPKDVIYNADKATKAPEDQGVDPNAMGDDDMDQDQDMDGDMGDDAGDMGDMGDTSDADMDGDGEMDSAEGDMGGDDMDGDMGDGSDDGDMDDGMSDDDSVEDFDEPDQNASPESLLQQVMDMLRAEAQAKTAQANAAAEEARAKQAEYTYKASQVTVSHQEELAAMQADMDKQKNKEKDAKQLANLAKFRVQKASTLGESFLEQIVMELMDTSSSDSDTSDTVASLTRQKNELNKAWAVLPTDDQDTANYKRQRFQIGGQICDLKIKELKLKTAWSASNARKQQQQASQASSANGNQGGV